jgi:hypothetical protein
MKRNCITLKCENFTNLNTDVFAVVLNFLDLKSKHNVVMTNKKQARIYLYKFSFDFFIHEIDTLKENLSKEIITNEELFLQKLGKIFNNITDHLVAVNDNSTIEFTTMRELTNFYSQIPLFLSFVDHKMCEIMENEQSEALMVKYYETFISIKDKLKEMILLFSSRVENLWE